MPNSRQTDAPSHRSLSLRDPSVRGRLVVALLVTCMLGLTPLAYSHSAPPGSDAIAAAAETTPAETSATPLDPLTLLLQEDFVEGQGTPPPFATAPPEPAVSTRRTPVRRAASATTTLARPNILFILADDLALNYLHLGGGNLDMPQLARLTAGTTMQRMYVNIGQCAPSRATLWTGLLPHQHGVLTNGDYLTTTLATLPRLLRDSGGDGVPGYDTGFFGKCHLNNPNDPNPSRYGFERWTVMYPDAGGVGGPGATAQSYAAFNVLKHSVPPTPTPTSTFLLPITQYNTDYLTQEAINFMNRPARPADQPFFAWVAFIAPHYPTQPPALTPTGYPLYNKTTVPWPPASSSDDLSGKPRQQQLSAPHKGYLEATGTPVANQTAVLDHKVNTYNVVTNLDWNVGRLLDAAPDDTIIVFMSDNGVFFGEHQLYQKGPTFYEEQVRMPFILYYKGTRSPAPVASNRVSDQLVGGIDVLPTLLDLVGLADRIPPGIPGRSFAAAVRGDAPPGSPPTPTAAPTRDSLLLEYQQQFHTGLGDRVPMRGLVADAADGGRWKWSHYPPNEMNTFATPAATEAIDGHNHELYKLRDATGPVDPQELTNRLLLRTGGGTPVCDPLGLAMQGPNLGPVVQRLRKQMARWETDTNDTQVEGRALFVPLDVQGHLVSWTVDSDDGQVHLTWKTGNAPRPGPTPRFTPTPGVTPTPTPAPAGYCTQPVGASEELEYQDASCTTTCTGYQDNSYNYLTTDHTNVILSQPLAVGHSYTVTIYSIARDGQGSYLTCTVGPRQAPGISDVTGYCS